MVAALGAAARVTESKWVDGLYFITLINLTGWLGLGIRRIADERFPISETFGKLHRFRTALRLVLTVGVILAASLAANHIIIQGVDEFVKTMR